MNDGRHRARGCGNTQSPEILEYIKTTSYSQITSHSQLVHHGNKKGNFLQNNPILFDNCSKKVGGRKRTVLYLFYSAISSGNAGLLWVIMKTKIVSYKTLKGQLFFLFSIKRDITEKGMCLDPIELVQKATVA